MNLPVIIDIIIGLVFIYLTLSLLASEIQELIATVLQWRAEHLKKSIEVLISGGHEGAKDPLQLKRVGQLAHAIYANPIIKDLNQGAKGLLSEGFRSVTHRMGDLYHGVTGTKNVFGNKSSGPSYIPAECFSASLLETLKVSSLLSSISKTRLERFKDLQLAQIQHIGQNLSLPTATQPIIEQEFGWLTAEFNRVVEDYQNNLASLNNSLDRMSEKLGFYIKDSQVYLPETELGGREFQRQMAIVKARFDSKIERVALLGQLQPSFSNLLNSVKKSQDTVAEIMEIKEESAIYQQIQETLDSMPESLKRSLYILAQRAEKGGGDTQEQLQRFQKEIEIWFDQSMERASGVYKRNAKGVAILLGTALAVAANADSIHIINRLSKDSMLRSTVNLYAQQLVENNAKTKSNNLTSLAKVQQDVDRALDQVALPFGWSEQNSLERDKQGNLLWPALIARLFGWILSGVAISMGAAFWFEALNKIINIRNAGKKPPSSTES
jgi:phage terminase Nu1 subunit (DNA packaging protein)